MRPAHDVHISAKEKMITNSKYKKENRNIDVSRWGEDGREGVCCSNCGHWKTIIGYMETSHVVAKC